MTTEQIQNLFDKHESESHKFDRVHNKRSNRADLHAFMLLDSIIPGTVDIISCAEHDQFWLAVQPEDLAAVVTEDQIVELIRCGAHYDSETSFYFFT